MHQSIERREFLRLTGGAVGATLASDVLKAADPSGSGVSGSAAAAAASVPSLAEVPRRRLGRIGIEVPPLGLGTAAMGHPFYRPAPFEEVVYAALNAGVVYLDTARLYDIAEERLAPILARRRKDVFLVTKCWARSKDEALKSLDRSLSLMGVDSVDLCHMHNVGQYTREEALGKGALLDGLLDAKKRGLIKHIGCSGHQVVDAFVPVLETGEIDLLMVAMNFVDRHTYNFEERVLPTARKHNIGIVCMKVYGGVTGSWDGYKKRRPGRLAADEHRQDAFDYSLSIPGVGACVVGIKSLEELRLAIQAVRNHRPLEGDRLAAVTEKGRRMAQEWGPHFGPVA